jgi:hypothetical protein
VSLSNFNFSTGKSGNHSCKPLSISRFYALDYFSDGAFYLLDTPGHATGHIGGLGRVTSNPASFMQA